MAASTDVRFGLSYGWSLGESGWNTGMDNNLLKIARAGVHLSVKDKDLATPPASPAAGDTYIVAASPTGAWVGQATSVAVWSGSAWVFYAPRTGWVAYIEDEERQYVFKAGAWGTLPLAGLGTAAYRNAIGTGDLYSRGGILGTVSQSAGVPTGAVIERGSNANGEYVRFADGTQICHLTSTFAAASEVTWTYPASFFAGLTLHVSPDFSAVPGYYYVDCALTGGPTFASIYRFQRSPESPSTDPFSICCLAVGRWY